VSRREPYLSSGFALLRAALYWGVWIACAVLVRRELKRNATAVSNEPRRLRIVSIIGLIAVALTMTFAAIDWLMSLTVDWTSSVYGPYFLSGALVSVFALLAVIGGLSISRQSSTTFTQNHLQAVGKLLLALVLFWAYLWYIQILAVWIGNLPREVGWYASHVRGGWRLVTLLLFLGHAVLPTLLLLFDSVRRSGRAMAFVGAWLLVMHYLDIFWLVMP
jgi:hypothetical protein